MGESIKSKYKPSFPKKYKGNANNIICRSSWERRFCHYCDLNENILEWGSEEFYIPYISPIDKRVHRYFPDFIIKVQENTGQIKTYVIEVKPKRQTLELSHTSMSVRPMQSIKQSGRLQLSFVKTEELILRSSQRTNSESNEPYRTTHSRSQ